MRCRVRGRLASCRAVRCLIFVALFLADLAPRICTSQVFGRCIWCLWSFRPVPDRRHAFRSNAGDGIAQTVVVVQTSGCTRNCVQVEITRHEKYRNFFQFSPLRRPLRKHIPSKRLPTAGLPPFPLSFSRISVVLAPVANYGPIRVPCVPDQARILPGRGLQTFGGDDPL